MHILDFLIFACIINVPNGQGNMYRTIAMRIFSAFLIMI